MSDVAFPSETESDALEPRYTDEDVDKHLAGQVQVSKSPRDVAYSRQLRRAARIRERAQGPITGYDKIGQELVGQMATNAPGINGENREMVVARNNERSVPDLPAEKLVEWVNRDPLRAKAAILSLEAKEEPDEALIELIQATVGTDGADIRAERDTAKRNAQRVRDARIQATKEARNV